MKDKDVMVELQIQLARDGTVSMARRFPSGPVSAYKLLEFGMLDIAKTMVASELKPGPAKEQP